LDSGRQDQYLGRGTMGESAEPAIGSGEDGGAGVRSEAWERGSLEVGIRRRDGETNQWGSVRKGVNGDECEVRRVRDTEIQKPPLLA
jgi:hypothetical protein